MPLQPIGSPDREPDFDPRMLALLPMVADGSDPGYADRLVALFERCTGQDIAQMRSAADQGDHAGLQRLVHSLKSTAAQLGARALAAESAQQEAALRDGALPQPDWPDRLQQRLQAFSLARQARQARPSAPAGDHCVRPSW